MDAEREAPCYTKYEHARGAVEAESIPLGPDPVKTGGGKRGYGQRD